MSNGSTLIALVPSRERLPGTPVGAPVTAPPASFPAAPSAPAPGGAKGTPGGAGLSGPPAGGSGGALVGPGGSQAWLDRIMNDSPGMRLQQRGDAIESPHGSFVRAKVQSEWPFEGRTNRNGEIWVDARGRVTVPDNNLLDALETVIRHRQGQPLDAREIKAHNDYVSRHVRPNGDVFRMPSNPVSGGLVGAVGDYAVAALRFIPDSAASPARDPAPPATTPRPAGPARQFGPANDAGIAQQAAQAAQQARARTAELNRASSNNPIPTLPGAEVVVGNHNWDQVGEVVRDHNLRTDRNPHDIALRIPVDRDYGAAGTRRETGYVRGSAMNIADQVDAMKRQGLIPRNFDLAGAARQVGVDWNSAVRAEADARAFSVSVDSPITLAGNRTYAFESAGEAQRRAIDYNSGSSGADYVAVPFRINREISTGKSSATGVSHEVWVGSPDQFATFHATMEKQGRIADGASAQTLLERAGIAGSMPGRVDAAKALNAPVRQEQMAMPEVPSLPRETGGAQQAERRNNSIREVGERAGKTLEDLEHAARQPFSRDLNQLVKDKADEMRGEGDGLGALMLEMTHLSKSAPGNAVGARGGIRFAPANRSALLDRIRNTQADKTAEIVNGPLKHKLKTLPNEFRDAMLLSLAGAKEPSEAVKAAILRLDPKGAKLAEPTSPNRDAATVAKRPVSIPTPFRMPDLPDPSNSFKFADFVGNNASKVMRQSPAEQPGSTVRNAVHGLASDWSGVAGDRDGLVAAPAPLRGREVYPDPRNPLAVARWVNGEWAETVEESTPPPVRDQMARTLDGALRSNRPDFVFEQGAIKAALDALHAMGARAFPRPGDATFGLDGQAVMPKSEDFGLPDSFAYVGPDVAGNPVFENANGDLVGPFSQKAATLADAAGPLLPKTAMTPFQMFRKIADLRVGVGGQVTEPLTGDRIVRGAIVVGLDTFAALRPKPADNIDAPDTDIDVAEQGVEATEKKPPEWLVALTRNLGIGLRIGEFLAEPRAFSRFLTGLFGVRGFGVNSALQFKVASLEKQAVLAVTGADSAFVFDLAQKDGIDTSEPGVARIRGTLSLNVSEVPTQMDAFGSDKGRKFRLNEDLLIDKTLWELYLPRVSFGPFNTLSGEYREESAGKIVIPKGTVLPKDFVDILNRRVGNSTIELTMPAPIADTPLLEGAVAGEIKAGLAKEDSFLVDLDPADIKARMIGGFAQRISSIPGKDLIGDENPFNNLDVNYMWLENLPNVVLRAVAGGLGLHIPELPFERSITGTRNPVNALRNNSFSGYASKVRWKVDTPWGLRIPGLAGIRVAFYAVREAQPEMRTSMMRSNKQATLSFNDTMGNSREVAVPVWLASMVAASDKSGKFEASLGMAKFPDAGIIVPPGGTEGLRGFLMEQWKTGTDTDKQEIAEFLDSHMSGSKAKISDNSTLMPADRDRLIELLYRIAGPVQRLPDAN